MAVIMRPGAPLTRRRFLKTAASSAAITIAGGIAKPSISHVADRPVITHGIQSGDVSTDSGVVWSRADRPSRMLVETSTTSGGSGDATAKVAGPGANEIDTGLLPMG